MKDHTPDKDILHDYVERLLAVEDDGQHALNDEDLRRVARELGLSDEDLARVDQVVEDHLTRGQKFQARELYAEAIAEIHQAAVLRPFDKEIATGLARAYLKRFQQSGDRHARVRAQRWARRAIEIDAAHEPAFDVLQACQQRRSIGPRVAMALGAVALVGGGAALWLGQEPEPADTSEGPPATTETRIERLPDRRAASSLPALPEQPGKREIPIALVAREGDTLGLALEIQRSWLNPYSGSSFSYELLGTLSSSDRELKELRASLQLLSESGEVLLSKSQKLYASHKPRLRPGDSAPVRALVFEKRKAPAIASARLVIELAELTPAADSYAQESEVELQWPGARPAHIDVLVTERKSEVKKLFDKRSHWLTLSVKNRGKRPVSKLVIAVVVTAQDGSLLARDEALLFSSAGPALPAGQTWVVRRITDLGPVNHKPGKRFASYAVQVVAFE